MDPWIAVVHIEPDVVAKIGDAQHGRLIPEDVREAIRFGGHDRATWNDDPVYGRRLVVSGVSDRFIPLVAYLKPVDETDGTWECLTAWRL